MPWYSITSLMTDKDSPLNQTLFDFIREDLDYLHGQIAGLGHPLGGSVGETDGPNGTIVNIGGAFYLPAPASGYAWQLVLWIQGKKSAGTVNFRFKLLDKTDTELQQFNSPNLTLSYVDYFLPLAKVSTALWGRLVVHYFGSGQVQSRNGAARAYLVLA